VLLDVVITDSLDFNKSASKLSRTCVSAITSCAVTCKVYQNENFDLEATDTEKNGSIRDTLAVMHSFINIWDSCLEQR
jgi:hypothetical protein